MTRRLFLSTVPGILASETLWAEEPPATLHHSGKVKSIIFYYCKGGPSQAHTFDKPRKVNDTAMHPFSFSKCGQSGLEISDLFPHLQKVADHLCVVRSGYGALAFGHGDASRRGALWRWRLA